MHDVIALDARGRSTALERSFPREVQQLREARRALVSSDPRTLLAHALSHPVPAAAGIIPLLAALFRPSWWFLPLALVCYVASSFLITKVALFRAHVHATLLERARQAASDLRALLLSEMIPRHQEALEELTAAVDATTRRIAASGASATDGLRSAGLSELLRHYAELAITYKDTHDALMRIDKGALQADIDRLSALLAQAPSPRHERFIEQELSVVRSRHTQYGELRRRISELEHLLGTIHRAILLAREESTYLADTERFSRLISDVLDSFDDAEASWAAVGDAAELDGALRPVVFAPPEDDRAPLDARRVPNPMEVNR